MRRKAERLLRALVWFALVAAAAFVWVGAMWFAFFGDQFLPWTTF